MNIAVFLDEVMPINGPLLLIPGSHRQGVFEAGHDKLTTSYPLWTLDKDTVTRLCRDAEAAHGAGIVAPTGKPGSVLMFHGNLVHASPPNITPYPRKIVYVTFCACSNHITKFTRAEWIAHRDFTPIRPVGDDALRNTPAPTASRRNESCQEFDADYEVAVISFMRILQRTQLSFSRDRHAPALQSPRFALLSRIVGCHEPGRGMYTLYSMRRSGNCYKVRLALAQLDIPHELVEIDILKGETRTPEFLKMNPERPRAAARGRARPLHRRVRTPSCGTSPATRRCSPTTAPTAPRCCNGCSSSSTASSPISAPPISG